MSSPSTTDYETLTAFFRAHRTTPTQISLLPSPSTQILTSGPHLGIPKVCLITAFAHARTLFATAPSLEPTALLDATLIITLTASEHLTAVNTRKRLLLSSAASPGEELVMLESLLTSPLPRHNKSPLLWSHRRWVLSTFRLRPDLAAELEVVEKSGEVHPRNYYAWSHARWALEFLGTSTDQALVDRHLGFCCRHVADVGAWAFLGVLVERMGREAMAEQVLGEVVRFAREVAPGHESLWCFVRTLIGRGTVLGGEARARMVELVKEGVGAGGVGEEWERERMLEDKAVVWIRRFWVMDFDQTLEGI